MYTTRVPWEVLKTPGWRRMVRMPRIATRTRATTRVTTIEPIGRTPRTISFSTLRALVLGTEGVKAGLAHVRMRMHSSGMDWRSTSRPRKDRGSGTVYSNWRSSEISFLPTLHWVSLLPTLRWKMMIMRMKVARIVKTRIAVPAGISTLACTGNARTRSKIASYRSKFGIVI